MKLFCKPTLLMAALVACLANLTWAQEPAQDPIGNTIRVDQLENRLAALEKKLFAMPARRPVTGELSADINVMVADMEARVTQLEEEWNRLYGSVEQLGHSVEQLSEKIDAFSKDVNFRLDELEKGGVSRPAASAESTTPSAANTTQQVAGNPAVQKARSEVPADISADELYKKAYDFLSAAAYDKARAWFEVFIERFPEHQLADNAYYWLGETHLVQNKPAQAVVAFTNGLKAFPKGGKASANLLKMGVAFERMGQNKYAQSSWEKLVKDFPDSPEAGKAKKKLDAIVE